MTSLSVLQSSWLYLYHLYQLWPLEKETGHCERENISNLVKLAVMTLFFALGFKSFLWRFGSFMYSYLLFTFPNKGFKSLSWRFKSLALLNSLEFGFESICWGFKSFGFFLQNFHFFTYRFESMSSRFKYLEYSDPYLENSDPLTNFIL